MAKIVTLSFPINNWNHLYSLQQAIVHNNPLTGRSLGIKGHVVNQPFLHHKDTPISINFIQVDSAPNYPLIKPDQHELGLIHFHQQQLNTQIQVDRQVFEELRKNLMEYADIEGIHIMVSFGLLSESEHWQKDTTLQIVQLDYAMKGDT
ncbi:hypothetical protein MNBD_GAMMA07-707 [hydrothermal vent metagenome]|uniref:Uncharacterized protein n=1 Tax=hydrothermal vent metagenome TaxID=652676 RepID=A0A3B0WLL4_9ZZZZ